MADPTLDTFVETLKFGIVGASGIIVNFTVLTIALYLLHLIESVALGLGILISMSTNYLFNRKWTFSSTNTMQTEYLQYLLLNLVGIVIQYVVALSMQWYFDSIEFSSIFLVLIEIPTIYLASFLGILLGFFSNFLFSKYIIFTPNNIRT